MSLAGISTLSDPDRRETFDHSHYQDHLAIAQAIKAQLGITVPVNAINPVGNDKQSWALLHQQMHDDMNRALSTAGRDLTDNVFMPEWVSNHWFEHQAAHQVLKI